MTDPRQGWDPQLEQGLPDSRLKFNRHRSIIRIGRMDFERVYCAGCGAPGGAVTAEWAAHVFYLCDACDHGAPPGTIEVPKGIVQVMLPAPLLALPPPKK